MKQRPDVPGRPFAPDMAPYERFHEFWMSAPADIWHEKADEGKAALDDGADIILLSGRYGTGKTLQVTRLIEAARGGKWYSEPAAAPKDFSEERAPVLVVDEFSSVAYGKLNYTVPEYLGRIFNVGKQAILTFTGRTQIIRNELKQQTRQDAETLKPDIKIYDLGDMGRVTLDAKKAGQLLLDLGDEPAVVEMVETLPALRNPRLFDGLFSRARHIGETYNADIVKQALHDYIDGKSNERTINLPKDDWHGIFVPKHAPFTATTSISTEEAIEIYKWLDLQLPTADDFTPHNTGGRLHYDPYDKN